MTGYTLEKIYFEHVMAPDHPESPKRLAVIQKVLDSYDYPEKLKKISARLATEEDVLLIHTKEYYDRIAQTKGREVYLDPDTSTSAKSFEAALYAAGGVLSLIDAVFDKDIENGFAFVRPPGHHAEKDKAMGFCLFNNVAIAASYALKKYNLSRVLILDFDLHHGNGTQKAFYDTNKVMYISTHQYPYYPGTGSFQEVGEGKGIGYNLNFPLNIGADDCFYHNIYEKIVTPIALKYNPELVLVSAGFDIYYQDPLGGMKVTEEGFAGLTQTILKISQKCSRSKVVFALEGGYSLDGLAKGVKAILDVLTHSLDKELCWPSNQKFSEYLKVCRQHYQNFWSF